MKIKPYIFLFTCVYNDRKHINKLFESIKNQTSNNFIYYLYDDCSDDSYDDLFKNLQGELAKKGVKSYFEKGEKNLGINKATEHCLKILRDKFKDCTHFVWINSDDWLRCNYIEYITKTIKKYFKYDIYLPNMYVVNDSSLKKIAYPKRLFKKSLTYLVDNFNRRQIYSHFTVKKNSFMNINPKCLIYDNSVNKRFYNDVCVLFLCSAFLLKTRFISKPLSYYLKNVSTLSSSTEKIRKNDLMATQLEYIKTINPLYVDKYLIIIKIVTTHSDCVNLIENKRFKDLKQNYKSSKKLIKELNINKKFLYPLKSSYILYHFPRTYYLIHSIKKKLF